MDRDLALKIAEEKAKEMEQLRMDLGGTHSSSNSITNQIYMAPYTYHVREEPHVRISQICRRLGKGLSWNMLSQQLFHF